MKFCSITRWIARPSLAAAIALSVGCDPYVNIVRLEPGATADSAVFRVSEIRNPNTPAERPFGFSVLGCDDDRQFWTIASAGGRGLPLLVTYGREISGYATRSGPLALQPGCYRAIVSGSEPTRFVVMPDRRILPRDSIRR